MSAVVDRGGQRKKVQYSALHQLAAKRPQMLLDLDVRLDEGMMAFWRCEEGELTQTLALERWEYTFTKEIST